jgi:ABC-2 type transport system permease protein
VEPGVSAVRAAWLLIRLRWRRVRNQLLARGFGGASSSRTRAGTPKKARHSWLFALLIGVYLPFIAYQQARRVIEQLTRSGIGADVRVRDVGGVLTTVAIRELSIETLILMAVVLVGALANKELSAPEWDLEWAATLPISNVTLLATRILERTFVNPVGLLLLWTFTTVLALHCGFGRGAPLLAAGVTLSLLLVIATGWTVIDTVLRLALAPPRLRNLQALISLTWALGLFLVLGPALGISTPVRTLGRLLPAVVGVGPAGLAVRALTRQQGSSALRLLGMLFVESVVIAAAGVVLLSRLLRLGIVTGGGRESGRRSRAAALASARLRDGELPGGAVELARWPWLSAIQRRELRLLGRDRNFLVQTLVLPVLIVGVQIFLRTRGMAFGGRSAANPAHAAAAAFGISAYAIMFSAFQTLNAEGPALWVLYTLPYRLETLLRQKAALWAGVSMIFPAALLGFSFAHDGVSRRGLGLGAIAMIGVPIHATIATALGVFASDPLSAEVQRRLRPAYVYLYMALAGIYTFALYASDLWQRGVLMILSALVALALWQKARDQLPYLLDPTASPPARVSVADGLIAALVFFATQGLVTVISLSAKEPMSGRLVTKAFIWAGAVTFFIMRFAFWRLRASGVPRVLGDRILRASATGLSGALVASVVGLVYLLLLRRLGRLPTTLEPMAVAQARSWMVPLAIVAAPVFEEFIFRGLIFGGLRRSLGPWPAALASAGIFGIVHPPLAVLPVFCMGLVAARVYDRAGMLLAPMMVHAGYNAAVTLLQPLLTR